MKTGVSGVGGRPVQLASDEAELTDDDDSNDCFRERCAAVKACLGVLGLCIESGGGEFF